MKATTAALALTALIGISSAKPVEVKNNAVGGVHVAQRRGFLSMLMGGDDDDDDDDDDNDKAEETQPLPGVYGIGAVPTQSIDLDGEEPSATPTLEARAAQLDAVGGVVPGLGGIMGIADQITDMLDADDIDVGKLQELISSLGADITSLASADASSITDLGLLPEVLGTVVMLVLRLIAALGGDVLPQELVSSIADLASSIGGLEGLLSGVPGLPILGGGGIGGGQSSGLLDGVPVPTADVLDVVPGLGLGGQ